MDFYFLINVYTHPTNPFGGKILMLSFFI